MLLHPSPASVDVCCITVQIFSWARAPWIMFVVLGKHQENKIASPPMKRNTFFPNQLGHFGQNWCTPVGKLFGVTAHSLLVDR